MKINRKKFYEDFRKAFNTKLTQAQVNGYEAMFDYWETSTMNDNRWLAYALATAYHETGGRMEAVREGFCDTDICSIKAVTKLFKDGKIRRNYALPHPNGQSYFGRGLVQLTHGYNYEKLGIALGIGQSLYNNPSLALDLSVAVKILFIGMRDGLFTTKRFTDYFDRTQSDWVNARQIINGLDQAELIDGYGQKFYSCLT
jgi:hypothetical protein